MPSTSHLASTAAYPMAPASNRVRKAETLDIPSPGSANEVKQAIPACSLEDAEGIAIPTEIVGTRPIASRFTNTMERAASNRTLRLALIIPSLSGGGAERVTLRLAGGLLDCGHAVDLVLFSDNRTLADEIPRAASVHVLTARSGSTLQYRARLAKEIGIACAVLLNKCHLEMSCSIANYMDTHRPHCVVPSLRDAKVPTLLAMSLSRHQPALLPVVHTSILRKSWKLRLYYRRLLDRADNVVAVSDGVADSIRKYATVCSRDTTRIYNPVVADDIMALAQQEPEHPWFQQASPPILLSVGRLVRQKDFPTLLRAFARILDNRQLRLIILGEGRWRKRLERLSRKLEIAHAVSMPGWVANPYQYMRRSSALVLSSRYEGLPTVLIEALACGCPCISTDCPSGPREILDAGRLGPLVPVGDHVRLAEAIADTLDNPPSSESLRVRAEEFSIVESVSLYNSLFANYVRD